MDDEPKKEEDVWSVEPPKEGGGKAGKVLRVALIVAALAAAAAVVGTICFGQLIKRPLMGVMVEVPVGKSEEAKVCVGTSMADSYVDKAESTGHTIVGGHIGTDGE